MPRSDASLLPHEGRNVDDAREVGGNLGEAVHEMKWYEGLALFEQSGRNPHLLKQSRRRRAEAVEERHHRCHAADASERQRRLLLDSTRPLPRAALC